MTKAKSAARIDDDGAARLLSLIERIERLTEERAALGGDIKDIYAEAESAGFDKKVLRRLVADRKLEPEARQARDALLAVYRRALGELADMPLGESAIARVANAAAAADRLHDIADDHGGAGSVTISSGGKTVSFGRKARAEQPGGNA